MHNMRPRRRRGNGTDAGRNRDPPASERVPLPDELWAGNRDEGNRVYVKDPSLLKPAARSYADLPGGHSEGYDDTFKQVFRRFYASIRTPDAAPEYPQFADGLRQLKILDAVLQSNRARQWTDVPLAN